MGRGGHNNEGGSDYEGVCARGVPGWATTAIETAWCELIHCNNDHLAAWKVCMRVRGAAGCKWCALEHVWGDPMHAAPVVGWFVHCCLACWRPRRTWAVVGATSGPSANCSSSSECSSAYNKAVITKSKSALAPQGRSLAGYTTSHTPFFFFLDSVFASAVARI